MPDKSKDITFEIVEHIGIIGTNKSTGWEKELNMVSWNGMPAKFDIREWDEDHKIMSRGVTFHKDEILMLKDLLASIDAG